MAAQFLEELLKESSCHGCLSSVNTAPAVTHRARFAWTVKISAPSLGCCGVTLAQESGMPYTPWFTQRRDDGQCAVSLPHFSDR